MPFGRKLARDAAGGSEEEYEDTEVEREDEVDLSDGDEANADDGNGEEESAEQDAGKSAKQPLHDEVIIKSKAKGKNPGGAKSWQCKHCKKSFTSSFTRIRVHFFGPPPGQKPNISRCSAVQTDRNLYKRLWDKVHVHAYL
jgi:hypothetical protein